MDRKRARPDDGITVMLGHTRYKHRIGRVPIPHRVIDLPHPARSSVDVLVNRTVSCGEKRRTCCPRAVAEHVRHGRGE
jgi:hypothetical protein